MIPVLLTIAQFRKKHPWATEGGLRHALHFGESTGFNTCVVRFGRKVLLDEAKVFEWLREHGKALSTDQYLAKQAAAGKRRRDRIDDRDEVL